MTKQSFGIWVLFLISFSFVYVFYLVVHSVFHWLKSLHH